VTEHSWPREGSPLWEQAKRLLDAPGRNGAGVSSAVSAVEVSEGEREGYCAAALPYKGAAASAAALAPAANGADPQRGSPPAAFAITLGEFIDKPRPDVPALITDVDGSPLVAKESLTLLGARGGRGKTTLFVDLMVHAALGRDYLCFTIPAPVGILLVENEGPEHLFAEKLEARIGQLPAADQQLVRERVHVRALDWGGFNLGNTDTFNRLTSFL